MTRSRTARRRNDRTGLIWTATAFTDVIPVITPGDRALFVVFDPIIDVMDEGGQSQHTLLRIRGWVSCVMSSEANDDICVVQAYAMVVDASDPSQPLNPSNIDVYTREDILWTGGTMFRNTSGLATEVNRPRDWDIDIKAKRRLRSCQKVILSFWNASASTGDLEFSGVLRSLVKHR